VGNTADAAAQGVWQYNTGSSWVDIGAGAGAPTDATALVLPTSASLRFLPNVANYNELSTKLSEAQAQFNQLSQRNTQLTGQINELTSTNRGLTGQVSEVNKQLSDLNRQAAESNRKAAEAAARVALLERQLADVREQLKNATAPAPK
jgi:septal ring factor EnvC (AmiA/AmiB activator)